MKGYWSSDTTYSVIGNIQVPAGDTLIIEAGTTVQFDGLYSFEVNGLLTARGSAEDSIYFTSSARTKSPGDWHGIRFNDPADDNSILSYCVIEYGAESIYGGSFGALVNCDQANPTIEYCRIRHSLQDGINSKSASPTIIHNDLDDLIGSGLLISNDSEPVVLRNSIRGCNGVAIFISGNSSPIIESNNIEDNVEGITVYNNGEGIVDIRDNNIHNTEMYAILIEGSSNVTLTRNDIYFNLAGIGVMNSSPLIENNDIYNNEYDGINIMDDGSHPSITMNLIMGNSVSINSDGRPNEVSYNIMWNNQVDLSGNSPVGVGTVITVNSNGDSIDAYFNLFQDPLLASTESENSSFLLLRTGSPCIDAGGTDLIQTDTSDIGSHPYSLTALGVVPELNTEPNAYILSPAYPNPFNPSATIKYALKDEALVSLRVYDLLGREVRVLVNERQPAAYHSVVWDGRDRSGRPVPSGVYITRLVTPEFSAGIKMVLLK
ncbi:MAG: right-handed parallel beta-helix repeat-containing protein [Candidatus Neomarinimicrobiota bacterium]